MAAKKKNTITFFSAATGVSDSWVAVRKSMAVQIVATAPSAVAAIFTSGVANVDTITSVPTGDAASLQGKYVDLYSASNALFRVWLSVNSNPSGPAAGGGTLVPVVVTKSAPCVWTLLFSRAGGADRLQNKWVDFDDGSTQYRAWFNRDGEGVAPATGGRTLAEVAFLSSDTVNQLAEKFKVVVDALANIGATRSTATVTVTNSISASSSPALGSGISADDLTLAVTAYGGAATSSSQEVADAIIAAVNLIADTPFVASRAGTPNVDTITFANEATTQSGEHFRIYDTAGNAWGASLLRRDKQRITPDTVANTTSGDYIKLADTSGVFWAVALCKRGNNRVTLPDFAGAGDGDHFILTDKNGTLWAIALDKSGKKEKTRITFPAFAGATSGDHVIFQDHAGVSWAISLDKTGSAPAPTGALYAAIAAGKKVHVDISSATTAADVCTAVKTAWDGLTGENAWFTATDNLDGTLDLERTDVGAVATPEGFNSAESASGSVSCSTLTQGVNETAPTGALWVAIDSAHKAIANVYGQTTAANLAAVVEPLIDSLSGFSAVVASTDNSNGTVDFLQAGIGAASVAVKSADGSGAGAITTSVLTASTVPTGAIWTAVAGARKSQIDLNGLTTAADIGTALVSAFGALSGWSAVFTATDNSGTVDVESDAVGAVAVFVPKSYADGGAGSIAVASQVASTEASGARWTGIASGKKVSVSVHGLNTAAAVRAAVESALGGLSGFNDVFTLTNSTADLVVTSDSAGAVTVGSAHNAGETGAGSSSLTNTTAGTGEAVLVTNAAAGECSAAALSASFPTASLANTTAGVNDDVNAATDVVTVTLDAPSGTKVALTTAGSLPTGLSATNYYLRVSTAGSTFTLYDSAAHAIAGGATGLLDITADGSGAHTLTPDASISWAAKLQVSADGGSNWDDTGDTYTISAEGQELWLKTDAAVGCLYRIHFTATTGALRAVAHVVQGG
jgi:hypothetical protein